MRKLFFCASCDAEPLGVAAEPNLLLYRDEDVLLGPIWLRYGVLHASLCDLNPRRQSVLYDKSLT